MKIIIVSLALLLGSTHIAFGQPITQKATKEICDCLNQTNIDGKDAQGVTEAFQNCFLKSAMPYFMDLIKEMEIKGDITTEGREMGREMGEKLAKNLLKECPTFVTWSMKMADTSDAFPNVETTIVEKTVDGSFKGKLKGRKVGSYTTLTFTDDSGDEVNLIWLRKFAGDELLLNGKETTTKAKKLQVKWNKVELYDQKTQKYVILKEIVELIAE